MFRQLGLLGGLSVATDQGAGAPMEEALKRCLVATRLARAVGCTGSDVSDVIYTSLLQHLGCTAFSHEGARIWGDDIAAVRMAFPTNFAQTTVSRRTSGACGSRASPNPPLAGSACPPDVHQPAPQRRDVERQGYPTAGAEAIPCQPASCPSPRLLCCSARLIPRPDPGPTPLACREREKAPIGSRLVRNGMRSVLRATRSASVQNEWSASWPVTTSPSPPTTTWAQEVVPAVREAVAPRR